jgi:hypothetical protein
MPPFTCPKTTIPKSSKPDLHFHRTTTNKITMEQVNPLPKGTAYLFLRTFPPLTATELDVQDWIRIWYRGSEYQQPNHHLHHDFTI